MKSTPRYTHDCSECVYLGRWVEIKSVNEFTVYDLYFCNQGKLNWPTLIARYGNEGPEYISGLDVGKREYADLKAWYSSNGLYAPEPKAMGIAYHRALLHGLIQK